MAVLLATRLGFPVLFTRTRRKGFYIAYRVTHEEFYDCVRPEPKVLLVHTGLHIRVGTTTALFSRVGVFGRLIRGLVESLEGLTC